MNLVTGATGLLGTHVLIELLRRGECVRALHRSDSDLDTVQRVFTFYGHSSLYAKIQWAAGDVLDISSLSEAMSDCHTVYHSAAVVSYHRKDRQTMYKVNVEGTANMVNMAMELGVERFCHVSSIAAIGRETPGVTLDENSPWVKSSFNTHYGTTKHLSEMEVWRGIQEGLNAVIINPGFIVGPGIETRSSTSIFQKIRKGLPAYTSGGTGYISAVDVAKSMVDLAGLRNTNERFIAVSENLSMREFFEVASESLGIPPPQREASQLLLHIARWADAIKELFTGEKALITKETVSNSSIRFFYDSEKLKKATGIVFQPVREAIENTVSFIRQ
ncbi:MAG: SDR family oxidoreductase [Crocinitomicaceae bacterium]|nr:SDR family oxidoreductase [Crocinitomicaceae bacterium]